MDNLSTNRVAGVLVAVGAPLLVISLVLDHDRASVASLLGSVGTTLLLLAVVDLLLIAAIARREQAEREQREHAERAAAAQRAHQERLEQQRIERINAQMADLDRLLEDSEKLLDAISQGELARTLQEVRRFQIGLADTLQGDPPDNVPSALRAAVAFANDYATWSAESDWMAPVKTPQEYRQRIKAGVQEIADHLIGEIANETGMEEQEREALRRRLLEGFESTPDAEG